MSSRAKQKQANRVVREQLAKERARTRRMWVSIGAVLVLVLAGLGGWAVYQGQRPDSFASPANTTAGKDGLVVGSGGATIDVYLDFICPACGQFEKAAGDTLDNLVAAGKAKLVYHPVAFLDRASSTEFSTRAAAASGCASDAGKTAEFVKVMYANQPAEGTAGLSDDEIIRLAGTAGITGDTFAACVRDGTYRDWVAHVTDKATERGVNGTPTVFVNGRQVAATVEAITKAVG